MKGEALLPNTDDKGIVVLAHDMQVEREVEHRLRKEGK